MKKSIFLTFFILSVSFLQVAAQKKLRSFDSENETQQVEVSNDRRMGGNYFDYNFIPTMSIGWGFVNSDGYAYEATFGVNYEFAKNLYVGARIGYLGGSYYAYNYGIKVESKTHFISIPLELGYTFISDSEFGVVPFVGLGLNIGCSGESKINNQKMDLEIGGDLGVDARLGLRLMLAGFTISGTYHCPLNDKQEEFFGEDAYPEISIGWFLFD